MTLAHASEEEGSAALSTLTWKIPGQKSLSGLPSKGLHRSDMTEVSSSSSTSRQAGSTESDQDRETDKHQEGAPKQLVAKMKEIC